MIFETHAHYDDEQFQSDRDLLIQDLLKHKISNIINVSSSVESISSCLALSEKYDKVYAALGVHPSDIADLNEENFAWIREQCQNPKAAAVGEIGLDYYWDKEEDVRKKQREWFFRQMKLAEEVNLPVIIHSRDAAEDTMQIMREVHAENIPGVIHCYSYSLEMAIEFVKMGYYIGVGGVVTFKNARKLKETVAGIPLDRILLETDAPYLAPEPNRGKRNHSGNLIFVAEKVAELKGITPQEVEDVTGENARRLFAKVK